MKNLNCFIYGLIVYSVFFGLSGCSNEEQLSLDGTADATTLLNISVSNAGLTKVGGVVSGSQFDDGASLGLFLTKEDGSAYDTPYNNIQYTSSTSGGNQVWTASTPILLTGTKANVYAYYPYDANYNDITAIPIDVTQNKDLMWADYASNINNANPTATLPMNHALSVIRFSLTKGDYSGAGNITSIKIKGAGMAKTGSLNAKTGSVTPTDAGTEIDLGATATLSSTPTNVEQLVIPTAASGNISVTIQMDDMTFEATSSAPITPEKSKAYKFGLAFSDSKLTMSTVTIGTITEVQGEDILPIVKTNPWADFTAENDGVYGIKADGSPMPYSEAKSTSETLSGVAIVMYGRALQISNRQMISAWGSTSVNIPGITDVAQTGGGVTNKYGYLPLSDGSYHTSNASYKIKVGYENWRNYPNTALADTCGWSNTEALITAHSGKTPESSYIGAATAKFRNGEYNQGFTDWFITSAAQLAYIYLNVTKINELLRKCSGATQISTSTIYYWSSSESSETLAWNLYSIDGLVNNDKTDKGYARSVRFCRYLN